MPTIFTLPWRWAKAERPQRTVVFVSRFDAKGLKSRWVLFTAGTKLRRSVLGSPGALGVSLRAHVIAGRYYTLSMWEDEASLLNFARGDDHRAVVKRISDLGPVKGTLISRNDDGSRPRWAEIMRWVARHEPGPYRMAPMAAPAVNAR